MDIFTEGSFIIDYGLVFWPEGLKFKSLNDVYGSHKYGAFYITRHELMDWNGVDYWDVLISCLNSHSDGTHSLQWIH